ncbi:MAG: hypothetical protein WBY28_08875, partial [Nitrososphaeraceae archaeon]
STLSYALTMKPTSAPEVEVAFVSVTDDNISCGGMVSGFRSLPTVCLLDSSTNLDEILPVSASNSR